MIRKKEEQNVITKNNVLGGIGEIISTELLKQEEFCDKGRLFSRYVIKPGSSIGRHTHEGDFEAYYILKGEATYYENGKEKKIYAGDLTLTKDGESHELVNNSNEDLEMIALVLYSK